MTLEVLKALAVILEFCLNQDSCKNCPMSQFCQKKALRVVNVPSDCSKSAIPVMESFFARAQVTRIYLSKCKKLLSLANWIQVVEL